MKQRVLDLVFAAELLGLSVASSYAFFSVLERGVALAAAH